MARWKSHGDISARDTLIRSQMGTVVTIASSYQRHASTLDELISAGNFGLLHALSKFDPDHGTRFFTYAVYCVRSYILAHLTFSKSLVTTGVRSRLLMKLRREARAVSHEGSDADALIAARLNVSLDRLRSLQRNLSLCDVPLPGDEVIAVRFDGSNAVSPSGEEALLSAESQQMVREAVSSALSCLDARERYIVECRLLADEDDELSLSAVGRALGVSRERARQIEARAKRKLKRTLSARGASRDASSSAAA